MKSKLTLIVIVCMLLFSGNAEAEKWKSLFNGKDLTGWTVRGKATWSVENGVLVGTGGMGHIYTDAVCTDFEFKGMFRVSSDQGSSSNSGLYFRCNAPEDNINGFPRGYEAQICNSQDAHTGWLWKPGTPTGKATELLTKDGEWFEYHIKMVGDHIQFWINGKPVMTYDDKEYKSGHFAIQGHNPGMKIEAKDLFYREVKK
ncbi:MAG TPA: DUF1080 domain-containing protein [Prolixibacteraceae bacterium]|nr:DUF1080 domain-containing protein [Prolixibacteraceae bacterium]